MAPFLMRNSVKSRVWMMQDYSKDDSLIVVSLQLLIEVLDDRLCVFIIISMISYELHVADCRYDVQI